MGIELTEKGREALTEIIEAERKENPEGVAQVESILAGVSGSVEPSFKDRETIDGSVVWVNPDQSEVDAAAAKFREAFAERNFSQRHEELGKMIDCHLCGVRHREGDPLFKNSRAHAEQKRATQEVASLGSVPRSNFAKPRFNPHHGAKQIQFAQLSAKIHEEDIAPYFRPDPEHPDNLIRRAQRIAAKFLRRLWIKPRVAYKHMQDHSRRINAGLEVPGSRYSHPMRDHKK
jgi:hypothetical protein